MILALILIGLIGLTLIEVAFKLLKGFCKIGVVVTIIVLLIVVSLMI